MTSADPPPEATAPIRPVPPEPEEPMALQVARRLADEAMERGALACVLAGSYARGEAHQISDLDLHMVGDGPAYELQRVDGYLVSTSWHTATEHYASLRDPRRAGAAVPGWRSAVILRDPHGVARAIQQAAIDWTWDEIGEQTLRRWVAEQVTGYAEEAHKLAAALALGREISAAVQRSILALRLAPIMSVHCRLLYDTENRLWEMVGNAMGAQWAMAQSTALGVAGGGFYESCIAALRLYVLAATTVYPHLTARQRAVVERAIGVARRAMEG